MLLFFIDPDYKIIIGSMQYEISDGGIGADSPDISMQFSRISYLTMKPCNTISFKNLSETPFSNETDFLHKCNEYVYDNEFKRRPYFTIDLIDTSIDPNNVPLNTNIPFKVKYNDPDNLDFLKYIDKVTLKDKHDFVRLSINEINKQDLESTAVLINSAFPGISSIRAKDPKVFCKYFPLGLRFKQ